MDILAAVQAKGVTLNKVSTTHGGEWAGPCPLCGGDDRFRCWPNKDKSKKVFFCRQCNEAGGDLIAFFRWADGMSYKQACECAGCEAKSYTYAKPIMPAEHRKTTFTPTQYDDPEALWAEKADKFVRNCHEKLMNDDPALRALLDKRGITAETAIKFKLGINKDEKYFRPRESWGLPTEVKSKTGKPKKLWIPRGLVVPYIVKDTVQRIRVRRSKKDLRNDYDPPYYFVPGSTPAIMLIPSARSACIVVESELDGILIHQEAGDLVGVLAMGTAKAKPDSVCARHLSTADVLLVALDYDQAGESGSVWWMETYRKAMRWPVPCEKDPGEMFKKVDVRQWVLAGLPPVYHVGSLRTYNPKKEGSTHNTGEKSPKAEAPERPQGHHPATVSELGELLRRYPIRIINTMERTAMDHPKNFQNPQVCDRVSELIFQDKDCMAYVLGHPEELIDGRNYYHG